MSINNSYILVDSYGFRRELLDEIRVGDFGTRVIALESFSKVGKILRRSKNSVVVEKILKIVDHDEVLVVSIDGFESIEKVEEGSSGESLSGRFGLNLVFDGQVKDLRKKAFSFTSEDLNFMLNCETKDI